MSDFDITRKAISAFESKDLGRILATMSELSSLAHPTHPAMMLLAHRVKSICIPTLEFTLPRVKKMTESIMEGAANVPSRF